MGYPATGVWYFVISVLSGGFLAWVPFLHAAQRLGQARIRVLAGVYASTAAALLVLFGVTPTDASGNPAGAIGAALATLALAGVIGQVGMAIVQLAPLRRQVYYPEPEPAPALPDPAILAVLIARERRTQARALAREDPLLARDLCVGRPDRRPEYDDGGLVDLNSAPADVIADVCGLDIQSAERIVGTRPRVGGRFSNVEEVLVMADVPVADWPVVTDRAILLD